MVFRLTLTLKPGSSDRNRGSSSSSSQDKGTIPHDNTLNPLTDKELKIHTLQAFKQLQQYKALQYYTFYAYSQATARSTSTLHDTTNSNSASLPRYILNVLDSDIPLKKPLSKHGTPSKSPLNMTVLIVPHQHINDWLFTSAEGLLSICHDHQLHRIITVLPSITINASIPITHHDQPSNSSSTSNSVFNLMKAELNTIISLLLPSSPTSSSSSSTMRSRRQNITYTTIGKEDDIVERNVQIVDTIQSDTTGMIVIEDRIQSSYDNVNGSANEYAKMDVPHRYQCVHRCLRFLNTNLIQGEMRIYTKSIRNDNDKTDNNTKTGMRNHGDIFDYTYLPLLYQRAIIAAFTSLSPIFHSTDIHPASIHLHYYHHDDVNVKISSIGLGSGNLPSFLRHILPLLPQKHHEHPQNPVAATEHADITTNPDSSNNSNHHMVARNIYLNSVELDPAILDIAKRYYGYHQESVNGYNSGSKPNTCLNFTTNDHIMDGVEYIKELAERCQRTPDGQQHLIIIDVNTNDLSHGISYTPLSFVSYDFLSMIADHCLRTESGMLLMNLGCRPVQLRQSILQTVYRVFTVNHDGRTLVLPLDDDGENVNIIVIGVLDQKYERANENQSCDEKAKNSGDHDHHLPLTYELLKKRVLSSKHLLDNSHDSDVDKTVNGLPFSHILDDIDTLQLHILIKRLQTVSFHDINDSSSIQYTLLPDIHPENAGDGESDDEGISNSSSTKSKSSDGTGSVKERNRRKKNHRNRKG